MTAAAAQALNLRDIHLPGAPAVWPPAPGWWLLAALTLGLLAWAGVVGWHYYRLRRERRHVLGELTRITARLSQQRSPTDLANLSALLRRLALLRFSRTQVAGLTGDAWLHFLDVSGTTTGFSAGPGRLLVTGPYQRELPDDVDVQGLALLIRQWVHLNTGKQKKTASAAPDGAGAEEVFP